MRAQKERKNILVNDYRKLANCPHIEGRVSHAHDGVKKGALEMLGMEKLAKWFGDKLKEFNAQ